MSNPKTLGLTLNKALEVTERDLHKAETEVAELTVELRRSENRCNELAGAWDYDRTRSFIRGAALDEIDALLCFNLPPDRMKAEIQDAINKCVADLTKLRNEHKGL